MKLSTRSLYGMRALAEIALASGHGPVSASAIATRQALSVAYLEQLLHRLKRQGLVGSIRGPHGGYVLAKDPGRISMADIVRVLDGTHDQPDGRGRAAVRRGAAASRAREKAEPADAPQHAEWIGQAVRHCVHERLTQSLGAVSLQDLCDEVRAIAGEPLEHRYVFHI